MKKKITKKLELKKETLLQLEVLGTVIGGLTTAGPDDFLSRIECSQDC